MAIGTGLGTITWAILHDLGRRVSFAEFLERGAAYGAIFGICALVWDALGA